MSWTMHVVGGVATAGLLCAMAGMAQSTQPTQPAHGQPETVNPQQPEGQQAPGALVFETESLDLGLVHDGGKIDVEFPFTNTSEIPIMITNVKPSCGCTDPSFDSVIQPGEKSAIRAKFNPTGKVGPSHVAIRVETDDPDRPTINLSLQATVEPIVKAEPTIIQLGDIRKCESVTKDANVTGEMEGFKVRFATTTDSTILTANVVDQSTQMINDVEHDVSKLEVVFAGRSDIGPISETVLVRTNDQRRQLLPIKVIGRVVGDVQIVPDRASLGMLRPGVEFERTLRVNSRNGEKFEILGVSADIDLDDDFTVDFAPDDTEDGPGYTIRIHGVPSDKNTQRRPIRGTLHVKTNVPGEEDLEVNIYGTIRPNDVPSRERPK